VKSIFSGGSQGHQGRKGGGTILIGKQCGREIWRISIICIETTLAGGRRGVFLRGGLTLSEVPEGLREKREESYPRNEMKSSLCKGGEKDLHWETNQSISSGS